MLPFTLQDATFVCSPAEMDTHCKIYEESSPLSAEAQEALDQECKEHKDIFSLHKGNMCHTELLTMDIDTGDYPLIAKRPFTPLLKHMQHVKDK